MTNETIALIIFLIWATKGRGLNLCFFILIYYLAYIASERLIPIDSPNERYYIAQLLIDSTVIISCCLLSYKIVKFRLICIGYAIFVSSSMLLELLMIFDEVFNAHVMYKAHEFRQLVSQPVDLLFATLGSGLGVHFTCVALHIFGVSSYNYDIDSNRRD